MQKGKFKIPRHFETLDQKFNKALDFVGGETINSVKKLLEFYRNKGLISTEEYSGLKGLDNNVVQSCINILDAIELLLGQGYINESQYEKARMKYFESIKK